MPGYFGPLCPSGQVALSSAPVSHDSHRNSTHTTVPGWAACPGCAIVELCPPVTLTTAGGTAALGVLQQLGGAAGPGRVPLLQSQPSCLILGKGAQVLSVTPIHLGKKEQAGVLGRLLPQPLYPSGETESGEQWACQRGLAGEGTGMASQGKGVEVPVGVPGCPPGRGKEPGR